MGFDDACLEGATRTSDSAPSTQPPQLCPARSFRPRAIAPAIPIRSPCPTTQPYRHAPTLPLPLLSSLTVLLHRPCTRLLRPSPLPSRLPSYPTWPSSSSPPPSASHSTSPRMYLSIHIILSYTRNDPGPFPSQSAKREDPSARACRGIDSKPFGRVRRRSLVLLRRCIRVAIPLVLLLRSRPVQIRSVPKGCWCR